MDKYQNWSNGDKFYAQTLKALMQHGTYDEDPRPRWKDGTPAHSIQIFQTLENYRREIPLNNFRNTAMKMGIQEMLWIYQDQTNDLQTLRDRGINWWDSWDIGDGTIGLRYGATLKQHDVMPNFFNELEKNPFGRRHIIDMWQYSDLNSSQGLAPCAFQTIWGVSRDFNTRDLVLNMTLVQRSNDYLVAGYINKFQYWGLLQMVAKSVGYKSGDFAHYTHNTHFYDRHWDAAFELAARTGSYIPLDINNQHAELVGSPTGSTAYDRFMSFKIEDWQFTTHNRRDLNNPLEVAV